MGKAYWAKSMVITRLTGVPYRQNDMVVSASSGRVLIRSKAVEVLDLDETVFLLLRMITPEGRCLLELWKDEAGVLGEHLRFERGQRNMRCYQRRMARIWCGYHHVDELRLEIVAVARVSDKMILVEVKRVEDIAEKYNFRSRRKEPEVKKNLEQ